MLEAVQTRLRETVPELRHRVEGALSFVELVSKGTFPQGARALVVPTGKRGGKPTDATGMFCQSVVETFGVVLLLNAQSATDRALIDKVDELITAVISTLAGWVPNGEQRPLQLTSGRTLSLADGRFVYELNFSIETQLRIPR
jgi:hypothetical protein